MGRSLSILVVLMCVIGVGCTSTSHLYNAQKNVDVREIVLVQYSDIHARHIFRERPLGYSRIRTIDLAKDDNSNKVVAASAGAVAGVGVGATAAAAGSAMMVPAVGIGVSAVSMSVELVRAGVENQSTEFLTNAVQVPDPQEAMLKELAAGLRASGYTVSGATAVKYRRLTPTQPYKIGESIPRLDASTWKRAFPTAPAGDAVLVVNVLNFGLYRVGHAFGTPQHVPFAVIGVKLQRADTHKIIHEGNYIGTATVPLPNSTSLAGAVKDQAALRAGYDQALINATKLIVNDLRPQAAAPRSASK